MLWFFLYSQFFFASDWQCDEMFGCILNGLFDLPRPRQSCEWGFSLCLPNVCLTSWPTFQVNSSLVNRLGHFDSFLTHLVFQCALSISGSKTISKLLTVAIARPVALKIEVHIEHCLDCGQLRRPVFSPVPMPDMESIVGENNTGTNISVQRDLHRSSSTNLDI